MKTPVGACDRAPAEAASGRRPQPRLTPSGLDARVVTGSAARSTQARMRFAVVRPTAEVSGSTSGREVFDRCTRMIPARQSI